MTAHPSQVTCSPCKQLTGFSYSEKGVPTSQWYTNNAKQTQTRTIDIFPLLTPPTHAAHIKTDYKREGFSKLEEVTDHKMCLT